MQYSRGGPAVERTSARDVDLFSRRAASCLRSPQTVTCSLREPCLVGARRLACRPLHWLAGQGACMYLGRFSACSAERVHGLVLCLRLTTQDTRGGRARAARGRACAGKPNRADQPERFDFVPATGLAIDFDARTHAHPFDHMPNDLLSLQGNLNLRALDDGCAGLAFQLHGQ